MAHELEIVDGVASMAYAGKVPWHGLGTQVSDCATPEEMMRAARLDWTVYKKPATVHLDGEDVPVGKSALVRCSDKRILDVVTDDWNPVQNAEAFKYFDQFVTKGKMKMETAGSLKDGTIVWALAKTNQGFSLTDQNKHSDDVESYLLFTNPHQFGKSVSIRQTNVRVVCNNTLTLALNKKHSNIDDKVIRMTHRREFDVDEAVAATMHASQKNVDSYRHWAEILSEHSYNDKTLRSYFASVYPLNSNRSQDPNKISKNAELALKVIDKQPGTEFATGSWWQAFNAVTFLNSHVIGRTDSTRVNSLWYGIAADVNQRALKLAVANATK